METPAAAPSQTNNEIASDIAPQPSSAITWIIFSGAPGEFSGDFIQAIQRVAFQQGHARDDRWIADYITTCFNGDALHWYSELPEETQESWRKLRTAILRRYPAASPGPAPSTKPTKTTATRKASSGPSRNTTTKSGLIEVLGDRTASLGYLCLNSESLVGITKTEANAVVINLPSQMPSEPMQLSLDGITGNERTNFRNLGLSLLVSSLEADPDHIPEQIQITTEWYNGYEDSYEYETGIPALSALCKGKSGTSINSNGSRPPMATWILACCGDSKPTALYRRRSATKDPSQRAAAAVWKYEKNSGELRIRWLMDNDREHELGAYIQRKSSTFNLHVHRVSDMHEADRFFDEDRVVWHESIIFRQERSSQATFI
ncbi:hypothetical protein M407DRAFT_216539 [Tulasnella calospora MUT 4182]|uniref:Uncharacterized protein n=1 Tax=Tulasnella calospora MUT 4182 TaxID=1051891 RepID=A0A0C3ME39_9AGAM|nr:hypothetical protein M407DRAFT_216539 [Tulasnella calospora MUT 4182]